jgi:hypothetical protein
MDQKLTPQNFTSIFRDSVPNIVCNIPKKAFEECIHNFNLPYLSKEEKDCVREFTKKYMFSMDYSLLYFSKKLI